MAKIIKSVFENLMNCSDQPKPTTTSRCVKLEFKKSFISATSFQRRLKKLIVVVIDVMYKYNSMLVRSLSGKNWQDRDKADKVSISFSRDS